MLVCQVIQVDCLRLLLSLPGVELLINKQDKAKQTVFHCTIMTSTQLNEEDTKLEAETIKRIEIIRLLIAAGCDPSICDVYDISGTEFFIRYMEMAENRLRRTFDWPREEMTAAPASFR